MVGKGCFAMRRSEADLNDTGKSQSEGSVVMGRVGGGESQL